MDDRLNPPALDRLKELVDQAAVESDRTRFAELLREITKVLAERRAMPVPAASSIGPFMETETLDIFSGTPDRDAVWMESVMGMENARARLRELSAFARGEYFIFHAPSHATIRESDMADKRAQFPPKKSGVA